MGLKIFCNECRKSRLFSKDKILKLAGDIGVLFSVSGSSLHQGKLLNGLFKTTPERYDSKYFFSLSRQLRPETKRAIKILYHMITLD